jgi:kynureninase
VEKSLSFARQLDAEDPLKRFRSEFHFPPETPLYFAGHSLGLMPRRASTFVEEALEDWRHFGVEGHYEGEHPWLPYHELLAPALARLVGAKETEVVAMNSLTVNLHLLLVSFYRPTKTRFRILIENNAFPSDRYAVDSHARFHGFDPLSTVVELVPRAGELFVRTEDIEAQIEALGPSLALVLLGNCNYLSGQFFDGPAIAAAAHRAGAVCGLNLAHGAGNLALSLHDWEIDFAAWCSYKYLNAGPGGVAGAFVHEKHFQAGLPRFEGWWGHDKASRFKMPSTFREIPTVEAWQLSNPPILQLAALRASLELFDSATMPALRKKGDSLTGYFESLLKEIFHQNIEILTPSDCRGSMLTFRFHTPSLGISALRKRGIALDYREPGVFRATPAPLYNSFEDVFRLTEALSEVFHGK